MRIDRTFDQAIEQYMGYPPPSGCGASRSAGPPGAVAAPEFEE